MATRRIMIEMKADAPGAKLSTEFVAGRTMAALSPALAKVRIDPNFPAVALPSDLAIRSAEAINGEAEDDFDNASAMEETFILRGSVEEEDLPNLMSLSSEEAGAVVGVYADLPISPFMTCIGSTPLGTDQDVERLLCVPDLKRRGLTGEGVYVAIVDTGINMAHLHSKGKTPTFDAARSWVPRPGLTPGSLPVGHGTMCAFDVCIAAPKCTLLDIAVLQSTAPGGTVMEGLLSDAVRAYAHLRSVWRALSRRKAMVVNNSWGMFQPGWDYPVGHPGNYSDNPNHPFNRIVNTLEREGVDILFAAGNCGNECPDGRCGGVVNVIYGANSHPKVLSVAGVDTQKNRVGYSTKGPGRLARNKPDLSGYTHFKGSGVYPADSGTSAATPVVAGVVAAVRTRRPYRPLIITSWPSAIRTLLCRTAIDRGPPGYDLEYGHGIVNGCRLAAITLDAEPGEGTAEERDPSGEHPVDEEASTPLPADFAAAGNSNLFFRLSRDAAPGRNVHNINGLPAGTRTVSLWVTEWKQPNHSHAGGAFYYTTSVQLFNNGTSCRFVFNLDWGSTLPTAVQMIIGS